MTDALRDRVGHTPGPWAWDAGIIPPDGPGNYADIYVLGEDREPIILAEFNDSLPEGRANARLMTAAPELLEALKVMANAPHGITLPSGAYIAAQQAIAKAEGRHDV